MNPSKNNDWHWAGVGAVAVAICVGRLLIEEKYGLAFMVTFILVSQCLRLWRGEKSGVGRKLIVLSVVCLVIFVVEHKAVDAVLQQHLRISGRVAFTILACAFVLWSVWKVAKSYVYELRGNGEPVEREPE